MATVSVALARDMAMSQADHEVRYIAAPVLGRPNAAAAGKLEVLAPGAPNQIAPVRMLLDVIGRKTWRLGDRPEQANAAKLGANFMIASAIDAMGEAASLVEGYNVSSGSFLEMITSALFLRLVHAGMAA